MGASDSVDRWWLIAEGAVPASVLIEAVETEGLGGGGVVAPTFGDVQVAGVFDSYLRVNRQASLCGEFGGAQSSK